MKDLSAAPARLFSVACALQLGAGVAVGDCALTLATASRKRAVVARYFIVTSKFQHDPGDLTGKRCEQWMSVGEEVKEGERH
jgi:hypothetical protein